MKMRKFKILSVILAALMLVPCAFPVYASSTLADIDGDGMITADDARTILRYSVKLEGPSSSQRVRADVDCDGDITASDARAALRIAVNLDSLMSFVLYNHAHPLFFKSFAEMHPNRSIVQNVYFTTANWCCYYTIHDVYRPVLEKLGYSSDVISMMAPNSYSSDKLSKAASSFFGSGIRSISMAQLIEWYIPSLLADHYLSNPEYIDTYVFWDYYDDVVSDGVIERTSNVRHYKPQVGDIVFMSNKTESYTDEGIPTIDHTAQIIMVNADGSFWCTEGSIIQNGEDGIARVRERKYFYNASKRTYEWEYNDIVNVLMVARPLLP